MLGDEINWHDIIDKHRKSRQRMIELNLMITQGITDYLKTIIGSDKFTIRFEDNGTIDMGCEGDLISLEEIEDFCKVFNLTLIINNRTVVENHLEDRTDVRTRYLFSTGKFQEGTMED